MKISVIVPVYNSELYIDRCINSILNQSYEKFEVIFIDDGSTDSSLDILKKYEKKDSRVRVIHQDNKGPGVARNTGLKLAKGEYIVFIDSDDIIDKYYFEKISRKNNDVIFIDVNRVSEDFKLLKTEYMSDKSHLSKRQFIRRQMTGRIQWGGVRKVVKKEIIDNNNIKFSNHKIGEEAIFSFLVLHYSSNIGFIDSPVYYYIDRKGSQSDYNLEDPWGPVAIELKRVIENMGIYNEYAETINAFLVTSEIVAIDRIARSNNYTSYKNKSKSLIKKYENIIDGDNKIDYSNMMKKSILIYFLIKMRAYLLVFIASKLKKNIKNNKL